MDNLIAEPHNLVDVVDPVDCYVIDLRHCQATVTHHLTGQVVYFVRTCPQEGVTNCPGQYTDDYLTTITLNNKKLTENKILDPTQITLDFWKAVGKAFISDFVDCAHGKLTKCAIVAAEILAPEALGLLVKAIVEIRYALRAGRAIEEAVAGAEAAGLEPAALNNIERVAADSLEELEETSTGISNVRARLTELMRRRTLGLDPASAGKFNVGEMQTALRVEGERGVRLTRDTSGDLEWYDEAGRGYDAVGNSPAEHLNIEQFTNSIKKHLLKMDRNGRPVSFIPVDVNTYSAGQIAQIREFIATLTASERARIFLVGAA
jgi:hypothetical protein